MNRGQGMASGGLKKATQRAQQKSRFDQRQRESALLQLMSVEGGPGSCW